MSGTASILMSAFPAVARAQDEQNGLEFSRIFGKPDMKGSPDLATARILQENRTAVPRQADEFADFLSKSPLLQNITGGVSNNDYYHLLQWNALPWI